MFYDLNVPITTTTTSNSGSKKGKGKQPQASNSSQFTAAQLSAIDTHLDLLIHLGYTVICFNQTVNKKVDPKTHINVLNELLEKLKPRRGILFLKRLSVILDEDSEKGFGLINANTSYFNSYDILSLIPTNQATFALACLTHTLPSPLTTHIISIPLTLPRFPFHLKHTLIRTAIKNGAVFEINYVGALGGESDTALLEAGAAEANGSNAKRNWWAAAKELVRVTKGKGLIVSGGVVAQANLRAPRDVANLITLLELPQDAAHAACTSVPKSLILRAQTRKTYRAVFSEPTLVIPEGYSAPAPPTASTPTLASLPLPSSQQAVAIGGQKKRPREEDLVDSKQKQQNTSGTVSGQIGQGSDKKKKRKNNKE
ncbi:RNase P subunit p30-domain-containing protein [Lentinula aff. detonsa]|uniref:RNase P subunit p30-domain-containing protein n=1 Tax=Lentinula aff. detonsa TaxID=2804958 RepID=A0AA38KU14_9AGAR|nr:RNase P subunit p30-domain-containing protein [Lentinula aff. detonsa]